MESYIHCYLIIHCPTFLEHLIGEQLGHRQTASLCPKRAGWVRNHWVHKYLGSDSFCIHLQFSSLPQESDQEMGYCSRSQHQCLVLSIVRIAKIWACGSFLLLRFLLFSPLLFFVKALKCLKLQLGCQVWCFCRGRTTQWTETNHTEIHG